MNRTCLSLAVACALGALGAAGGAHANPTGPEIVHGAATINASGRTLIVVPTPGAIIDWREFVIAPDETTRFVQASSSATVLNRIGSRAFDLSGRLESNARVLFIQSGRVFGAGIELDLPGITVAALRQPRSAPVREIDFRTVGSAGRAVDPWVAMIVPDTVPAAAGGGALLPAGVSAELLDARWPHVRVLITAPPGQALDVAQLVRKSGALGIFGSLLAVPRGQSAESTDVQVARAEMPVPGSPAEGEDVIAAPVIALVQKPPEVPVQVAAEDEVVEVPVIALAEAQSPVPMPSAASNDAIAVPVVALVGEQLQTPTSPAAGDDAVAALVIALIDEQPKAPVPPVAEDKAVAAPEIALAEAQAPPVPADAEDKAVAAPVIALAEVPPVPAAAEDNAVAAPVIAMAEEQARTQQLPAAAEDGIAVPIIAAAEAPTATAVEPLILAAVQTGTMHDGASAQEPAVEASEPVSRESVAVMPEPEPQTTAVAAAAAPSEPVIVASAESSAESNAESSVRRVALVASDTPVWPAPVKLQRVERHMPVIMFDRKGGIFHL